MRTLLYLLVAAAALQGCNNFPSAGWYTHVRSDERVYAIFVGEEADVTAKFPGMFQKQQFIEAMAKSPSSQYLTAGRPRYYTVIGEKPDAKAGLRIITLEILERDYRRS